MRSGSQAVARTEVVRDLREPRVRAVTSRHDRVADSPVRAEIRVVHADTELVGRVVVGVDKVSERQIGTAANPWLTPGGMNNPRSSCSPISRISVAPSVGEPRRRS